MDSKTKIALREWLVARTKVMNGGQNEEFKQLSEATAKIADIIKQLPDEDGPRKEAHCPSCGSGAIYLSDVSAYWDDDRQEWVLSDCDNPPAYCGECEAVHDADDCLVSAS